jgi:hypothetical protein
MVKELSAHSGFILAEPGKTSELSRGEKAKGKSKYAVN